MPYFLIDGKSVYDWLHAPKFHLVSFTKDGQEQRTRKDVEREFPDVVDYYVFLLNKDVAEIFGSDKPFSVLLRPDNYISFVSAAAPLAKLKNYFDTVIRGPQA
jgi:hypothetical protein